VSEEKVVSYLLQISVHSDKLWDSGWWQGVVLVDKLRRARSVLGWVTAWVRVAFAPVLFDHNAIWSQHRV